MRHPQRLLALIASLLVSPLASALSEFGIEGIQVVSTAANERRASVSVDGARIVWASHGRAGGAGGWDLWQASKHDGRWTEPLPLPLNSSADEFDPFFSADGRWLYFASNRSGGYGGSDLYRIAVADLARTDAVQNLGPGVNTVGDESSPTLSVDGQALLFASDGHGGAGGLDLWVAQWRTDHFDESKPVPGVNTAEDEFDPAWLGDGRALVFARGRDVASAPVQLWLAQCEQGRYDPASPLPLSFNDERGITRSPVVDASKPNELLVSGSARAPRAGQLDIYRMRSPVVSGSNDCR